MKKSHIIGAAVIAGSLLVAGGVVAGDALDGNADATAPAPSVAPVEKSESKCGLVGTRGDAVTAQAQWENIAGWYLPISTTDGPGIRDPAGTWSCFSHTPTGAVLAGYTISMRADGLAEDWQTVVLEQTVPGAAQSLKLRSTPDQASSVVTPRGFSVAAYSEDKATISYYLPSDTFQGSCTVNVAWLKGDWLVELQPDGGTASNCLQGVPDSFTPWGP